MFNPRYSNKDGINPDTNMYNTSTTGTTTTSSNINDTLGGTCASSAELAVTTSPTPKYFYGW